MVGLVKSIYHCNVCIRTLPGYSSLLSPVSRPQPRFPQFFGMVAKYCVACYGHQLIKVSELRACQMLTYIIGGHQVFHLRSNSLISFCGKGWVGVC